MGWLGIGAQHLRRCDDPEPPHTARALLKRDPEVPVLDHVRQRFRPNLPVIKVQKGRRSPLAHGPVTNNDVQDGLSLILEVLPDADGRQETSGSRCKRTHPPVEPGLKDLFRVCRIDDDRLNAGFGKRNAQRKADHATASYDYIRLELQCVAHGSNL